MNTKKIEFIIIVMTWQVFECNEIISEIFTGALEKKYITSWRCKARNANCFELAD